MAIPITNVSVRQTLGAHNVVLTSGSGEYTKSDTAVGVVVFAPAQAAHGGPQQGPFPTGNIYTVYGTDNNKQVEVPGVRYIGLTPQQNYQFTTE